MRPDSIRWDHSIRSDVLDLYKGEPVVQEALPRLAAEQLRHVLAAFKANMRALMNHVPQQYDGRLTLIEVERSGARTQLVRAGWSERTSGTVESFVIPGDHITALAPANAPALARVLRRLIERDVREVA